MSKFVFTIRVKLLFAFGIGVTIIFMAGRFQASCRLDG